MTMLHPWKKNCVNETEKRWYCVCLSVISKYHDFHEHKLCWMNICTACLKSLCIAMGRPTFHQRNLTIRNEGKKIEKLLVIWFWWWSTSAANPFSIIRVPVHWHQIFHCSIRFCDNFVWSAHTSTICQTARKRTNILLSSFNNIDLISTVVDSSRLLLCHLDYVANDFVINLFSSFFLESTLSSLVASHILHFTNRLHFLLFFAVIKFVKKKKTIQDRW